MCGKLLPDVKLRKKERNNIIQYIQLLRVTKSYEREEDVHCFESDQGIQDCISRYITPSPGHRGSKDSSPEFSLQVYSSKCRINLNSFRRTFIGNYNYGQALFFQANYINHSCDPNCFFYMVGRSIYVRASRPIAKGEEITIAYDQELPYRSSASRASCTRELLGCKCSCTRCSDESRNDLDREVFDKLAIPLPPQVEYLLNRAVHCDFQ